MGWVIPGAGGLESINGDVGPDVILDAADVGADPAGTATAAVAAHVALPDPHVQYTTEVEAVAAVRADDDLRVISRQTPEDAVLAFVSYLFLDTALVGGPISSPGPLVGGTYDFRLNVLAGGPLAAAGSDIELQLILDTVIIFQGPLQSFGVTAGRFGFYAGFAGFPLAPGNHTLDVQFRQPASPGTAQMAGAELSIRRVA